MTVEEMAEHSHKDVAVHGDISDVATNYRKTYVCDIKENNSYWVYTGYNTGAAGTNQPHNNLQPSKAVYIWFRTA